AAGLERVTDKLWVTDLGVVEVGASLEAELDSKQSRAVSTVVQILERGRKIQEAVAAGQFTSFNAAGRALGINPSATKQACPLARLPQDVQAAILGGQADHCSIGELLRVTQASDAEQQRARFEALLEATSTRV